MPDKYATLKNPIPAGEETIAAGKALYDQHCVGCHGVKGRGDGPKAPQLRRTPPDFADARSAAGMTDGAIFWRMTEKVGSEMPGFAGKLNENERWQVLHYLRTLAPKTAGKAAG